jgi:hypothetical protein
MLIEENKLFTILSIPPVAQKPALRCFDKHTVRKIRSQCQQSQDGENVGGVLLTSKNRQPKFINRRMSHLMKHHKKHIAGDKLHKVLTLFQRKFF